MYLPKEVYFNATLKKEMTILQLLKIIYKYIFYWNFINHILIFVNS